MNTTRRGFLAGLGGAAVAAGLPGEAAAEGSPGAGRTSLPAARPLVVLVPPEAGAAARRLLADAVTASISASISASASASPDAAANVAVALAAGHPLLVGGPAIAAGAAKAVTVSPRALVQLDAPRLLALLRGVDKAGPVRIDAAVPLHATTPPPDDEALAAALGRLLAAGDLPPLAFLALSDAARLAACRRALGEALGARRDRVTILTPRLDMALERV